MSNGQADPEGAPAPEGQPAPALVGTGGELREGWQESLDEDIRGEKCLATHTSFQGVCKSLVHSSRLVGKDKIGIPNEASSEAEWGTYWDAGGRPTTPEDYKFARPEALPEEHYSQELANAYQSLFHKLGLSQKQADEIFAFNTNSIISAITKQSQDDELSMTDLVNGLKTEWGQAYDQKIQLGNIAIEKACDGNAELKERLTQQFGNDPDFIRCMANLGGMFMEASPVKPEMIPTPADLLGRIEEESNHPAYGIDFAEKGFNLKQHKAQVEKVYQMRLKQTNNAVVGQSIDPTKIQ